MGTPLLPTSWHLALSHFDFCLYDWFFVAFSVENRCILKLTAEALVTCQNNNVLMLYQLLHVWGLGDVGFYSFVQGRAGCLFLLYCGVFYVEGIRSIYYPKAELVDGVIIAALYIALFLETGFKSIGLF